MEYGLVALWLVTFFALWLAGLPLAAILLDPLPDRGAGVALPLSLAVVTAVVYWVGRVAFGWPALVLGLAVLLGLSAVAVRRFDPVPDRWVVAETGLVFAAGFLFMVAVRAYDPAVHPIGGEKFLDFGLLQSLLRAETLPPEDMWFANEPVAYYYGGHLVSSLLAMLTDTPAKYAYNLALAGFYGMLVTAAYGIGGSIAARRDADRRTGGLWAAFLVGLASNLETAARVVLDRLPAELAEPLARSAVDPKTAGELLAWTPEEFSYWTASRVIPGTINEFPLFAWLNGDLHAHMTSTPFMLLVAAVLFAYVLTPEDAVTRRRIRLFVPVPIVGGLLAVINTWSFPAVMGLTAIAVLFGRASPRTLLPARLRAGVEWARETSLLGQVVGPALFADDGEDLRAVLDDEPGLAAGLQGLKRELVRVGLAAGVAVVVEALAFLVALPFFLGPASGRSIGLLPNTSSLGGLLLVHGAFLVVTAMYLASRVRARSRNGWLWLGLATGGLLLLSTVYGIPAVGLFLPIVLGAWWLSRTDGDVGFEAVLVAAGAGLALLVEFVFIDTTPGPGGTRLNTVFKLYAQVWLFWAVAAGGMTASLLRTVGRGSAEAQALDQTGTGAGEPMGTGASKRTGSRREGPTETGVDSSTGGQSGAFALADRAGLAKAVALRVALALLVVSTTLYAGFALGNHFGSGPKAAGGATLDATAFAAESHPSEAKAIAWLADNVEGQPTIVTAAPGWYTWSGPRCMGASAPSSLTGIPTVLGWVHERQYRGSTDYFRRAYDVRLVYTGSPGVQSHLLRKYEVEYVYFGPAERREYGPLESDVTIDDLPGVTLHKQWDDVRLYRVDRSALPPANESAPPVPGEFNRSNLLECND